MVANDKETRVSHSSPLVETQLTGAVLVCGECHKRSNGPTKLDARQVRKALKRDLSQLPGRLRVVECSCLGLCPKKALALMAVTSGHAPIAAEVCREDDVADFAHALAKSMR